MNPGMKGLLLAILSFSLCPSVGLDLLEARVVCESRLTRNKGAGENKDDSTGADSENMVVEN